MKSEETKLDNKHIPSFLNDEYKKIISDYYKSQTLKPGDFIKINCEAKYYEHDNFNLTENDYNTIDLESLKPLFLYNDELVMFCGKQSNVKTNKGILKMDSLYDVYKFIRIETNTLMTTWVTPRSEIIDYFLKNSYYNEAVSSLEKSYGFSRNINWIEENQ